MRIKSDQNLAHVALRAAYQGQPKAEIGLFFHLKVAATLVARAASLSVSLKQGSDEFVEWAGDVYGQMVDEVAAAVARGQDPRKSTPGIPAPEVEADLDASVKLDPAIWSQVKDAMGECRSAESAEVHAATLLATAAKLWVVCTLDPDSFTYVARHFHDEVVAQVLGERGDSVPNLAN